MQPFRRTFALVLVVLLSLGLAACGDDDETEAGGGDTEEAAGGDTEAYCESVLKLETIPEPDIDFEALSPDEQKAAVKKFATEEIAPLIDEVEKVVPEEIEADAKVLIAGSRKVEETGDFEAFESDPAIQTAEAKVHDFDLENCGWGASAVTATDYAYQGIPAELDAGPHSFDMTNSGKELHMLGIIKKNADTTETFDQLLELPEEEAEKKTTFLGEAFAPPGQDDYVVMNLEPGEYLAICFIPVGATPEAEESGQEPDGPPHFTQGMKTEFKVS